MNISCLVDNKFICIVFAIDFHQVLFVFYFVYGYYMTFGETASPDKVNSSIETVGTSPPRACCHSYHAGFLAVDPCFCITLCKYVGEFHNICFITVFITFLTFCINASFTTVDTNGWYTLYFFRNYPLTLECLWYNELLHVSNTNFTVHVNGGYTNTRIWLKSLFVNIVYLCKIRQIIGSDVVVNHRHITHVT